MKRDVAERGRTVVDVLNQYNRFVKPAYDDFIKPMMKYADIIVPFLYHNQNAVEMLVQNLKVKLDLNKKLSTPSPLKERTFSSSEINVMTTYQKETLTIKKSSP